MSESGVSIIICSWNRDHLLRETLHSLNEQAYKGSLPVEVLVVDNNSTDDTRKIVDELALGWRLGKLHYTFEGRQGKQFALNHGISASTYDILAFTDDDILFSEDWVCNIIDIFEGSDLELVGGKTIVQWTESGPPVWFASDMMAILAGVDLGDLKLNPPPAEYAPAGSNLIARRSLFERVGAFSELHFRHMDHEFGLRCAHQGANIAYDPSLIVYAPVNSACLTKRYFRRWSFKAGIVYTGESISTKEDSSATLLSAPLWAYRRLVEDASYLLLLYLKLKKGGPAEIFRYELRVWRTFGIIIGCWQLRYRSKQYVKWVEKWSQKKRDIY